MARNPTSLAVGALGFALVLAVGSRLLPSASPGSGIDPDDPCIEEGTCGWEEGFDAALVPSAAPSEGPVLGADACRDAGYLCTGLRARGDDRIMRWADGTPEIRVRVLQPEFEDPARQRAYQSAAASGILTWSGNPFPIRILRTAQGEADFEVVWTSSLGGSQLGVTSTEWRSGAGGAGMRVVALRLVTRAPNNPQQRLEARQIGLTATHEMGHALGLPHSDNRRDVMYPTNSASRLTADDFESMRALYRLPNGARIPPGDR